MTEHLVAITTARSAAQEAAFKYIDRLNAIAKRMRTDTGALNLSALARMYHEAGDLLCDYAHSCEDSSHGRVLAICLRRYADTLRAKASQPFSSAAELEAEAAFILSHY